jgi:hypothetical protein
MCSMDELRDYLNSLTTDEQEEFAQKCKTTIGYLRKALNTKPRMDGELCRLLDENSDGAVPKQSLRPDIWPELARAA